MPYRRCTQSTFARLSLAKSFMEAGRNGIAFPHGRQQSCSDRFAHVLSQQTADSRQQTAFSVHDFRFTVPPPPAVCCLLFAVCFLNYEHARGAVGAEQQSGASAVGGELA